MDETNNNKVLKSGVWYTISNLLLKCLVFITMPLFTRLLTKQEYGDYSNYLSWQNIASIFVTLNLEASLISAKFDYQKNYKGYIFSILTLSSVSTILWAFFCNIFMKQLSGFLNIKPIYVNFILLYCGFNAVVNIFQASERHLYKYKISVLVALTIAFSTSVLSVVCVLVFYDGLFGRIVGGVVPTVIIGLILYYIMAKNGRKVDCSMWLYALKVCLPYIPHLLALSVLNSMDRVMITKICGAEFNALYSVAYSCGAIVTLLMTSMNSAFSPWLNDKLYENDFASIRRVSKNYILGFCILALGIMLFAPEILLIMGGKTYMEAKYVMPPVAMGCVCQFLYTMFVNIEQCKKKTIGMAFASCVAALLNLILNAFFIPKFGYIAAAYTTLAGFLVLLVMHMFLVKKIGYSEVYSYKNVLCTVLLMMFFTIGVNFLYDFITLRILMIIIYILVLCTIILFKKKQIVSVIKNILT